MPSRPSLLAVAPGLLLIAIAVWEAIAAPLDARAVPEDAAWRAAGARVRAAFQPGDLIVFAPAWIDPVGRWQLGDLIPIEAAARMDAARYPRIWELAIRGARSPDTDGLAAAFADDVEGIAVRRYDRAPAIVVGDVLERGTTAVGARPTLELAEVGFAPHRCLQVVPAPGAPLRITFPAFPLGDTLVGYVGIADVFTRRDVRSAIRLDVELGGRVIASATAGVDDGWVRFAATTPPGPAELTFVAHARDPGRRVCFAAEARR